MMRLNEPHANVPIGRRKVEPADSAAGGTTSVELRLPDVRTAAFSAPVLAEQEPTLRELVFLRIPADRRWFRAGTLI